MFPRNQDIRQYGDHRTFYKGEKVAISDGYFKEGIYMDMISDYDNKYRTYLITSYKDGTTYPERWVDASHVGKITVSSVILKSIFLDKIGDPYLTKWVLNQGY